MTQRIERDFATDLILNNNVAVYVKLPDGFYVNPVGHYNPDWRDCISGKVWQTHIFVAETTGPSMSFMQLRSIEESKIQPVNFKAISGDNVVYDVG